MNFAGRLALGAGLGTLLLSGQGWFPHEGGRLQYRVQIRFGEEPDTMPAGWKFGRVSAVAADERGEVYVFHRGNRADPLVVFNAQGQYVRSWGRGLFRNPHGLRVDRAGKIWITDTGHHQVMRFTREGRLELALGTQGKPGAGRQSFNRPTDIAFSPDGRFVYVSDGYGNSRVVKFTYEGAYVSEWGAPGTGPGEFNTPHSLDTDSSGTIYVSDRENNRIQIFDPDGRFLKQWTHLGATQGISITTKAGTAVDEMWVITHRNNIENLAYDTLAGRLMKIDIGAGRILGAMESPGHWVDSTPDGLIFVASLTGNVFRWYPGWLSKGLGPAEGIAPPR